MGVGKGDTPQADLSLGQEGMGGGAVDLFCHAPVEAAQAGLGMGDGDVQLECRKRPGECGIGVAIGQHPVGLFVQKSLFNRLKLAPGHRAMGPPPIPR